MSLRFTYAGEKYDKRASTAGNIRLSTDYAIAVASLHLLNQARAMSHRIFFKVVARQRPASWAQTVLSVPVATAAGTGVTTSSPGNSQKAPSIGAPTTRLDRLTATDLALGQERHSRRSTIQETNPASSSEVFDEVTYRQLAHAQSVMVSVRRTP